MSDKSILGQWNEEDPVIDVALDSDQCLQKFLVRRIAYERELRIFLHDDTVEEGYITCFDKNGWFQLSRPSEETNDILLHAGSIHGIEETGRCLRNTNELIQVRIRNYSRALKRQCDLAIKNTSRSNYTDREVS